MAVPLPTLASPLRTRHTHLVELMPVVQFVFDLRNGREQTVPPTQPRETGRAGRSHPGARFLLGRGRMRRAA